MVFSITKIAGTAIVGLFAAAFFKDAFAQGLGKTLGDVGSGASAIGSAGSSIGSGVFELFKGIGSGTAQLLNPLFTLKDLAGPIAGVAAGGTQQQQTNTFAETGAAEVAAGTSPIAIPQVGGTSILSTGRGSLSISDTFDRITSGLSIRGTPLAQNAISRNEPTFGGVLNTAAGGSRAIRGSEALFARLASNLSR